MENEVFTFKMATRANEHGEWVIRCYRNGKRYPAGDAFETDKLAAEGTLAAAIKHEEERQAATGGLSCLTNKRKRDQHHVAEVDSGPG